MNNVENPFSTILPYILLTGIMIISLIPISTNAQQVPGNNTRIKNISDSAKSGLQTSVDTGFSLASRILKNQRNNALGLLKDGKRQLNRIKSVRADSLAKSMLPVFSFKNMFTQKPLIKFGGGTISYNFNYRSYIDTPFAESNIQQHSAIGNFNMYVGSIPFRINYLFRRSNSTLFKNINDIQVQYDAATFNSNIKATLKQRLLSIAPSLKDSLLERTYQLRNIELKELSKQLNSPITAQKLVEYKELLSFPAKTQTDSTTTVKENQLRKEAVMFINTYEKNKKQAEQLQAKVDSLAQLYQKELARIQRYKTLVSQKLDANNTAALEDGLKAYGVANIIPKKYFWLMNVRKFGLGRNQLNYSELTTKNISLTGVNFEYNSWYYLALSAGTVDYRFRDFVINKNKRSPQFLYMIRVGIGKVESNHFFITALKGKKQLFAVTNSGSGSGSVDISTFAAEAKIKLTNNGYVLTEAAQSLSPDFRRNPASIQKFSFDDGSNKAFSTKVYYNIPRTQSRIEGMYKYTGANYQSFSSYQTNAELKAWYLKADQLLFNRKLKIAASLKSNEFSNPYIVQRYQSNTVYKSIQLTYRQKKMPMISIGYMPASQITSVDSQLVENHFYSFNATLSHSYKIGERKSMTTFMYNRFYNNESDTAFLYYNAQNVFFNQVIYFTLFTMNLSISHSVSPGFELNVFDGGFQFPLSKQSNISFGVKVNDFDRQISATGAYGGFNLILRKIGSLSMQYDGGFIPGSNHRFVKNNMMNLNFLRSF